MKNRTKINKIEIEDQEKKINKSKNWFFDNINKINLFSQKNSGKKEKSQITNIRNERQDITTDLINIKKVIKEYQTNSMSTNVIT